MEKSSTFTNRMPSSRNSTSATPILNTTLLRVEAPAVTKVVQPSTTITASTEMIFESVEEETSADPVVEPETSAKSLVPSTTSLLPLTPTSTSIIAPLPSFKIPDILATIDKNQPVASLGSVEKSISVASTIVFRPNAEKSPSENGGYDNQQDLLPGSDPFIHNNTLIIFVASFFAVTISVLVIAALAYKRIKKQKRQKHTKTSIPNDLPSVLLRHNPSPKISQSANEFQPSVFQESIIPLANTHNNSILSDNSTLSRYLNQKPSNYSLATSRPISRSSIISAESLSKYVE